MNKKQQTFLFLFVFMISVMSGCEPKQLIDPTMMLTMTLPSTTRAQVQTITDVITVSVTNDSDNVNGNTSDIQSLLSNPGADGISFREALIAANGTFGAKAIVFDPSLKEATITIARDGDVLLLASGNLTINGDIDQNGEPDITLDGHLGQSGTPSGPGLSIVSSHNTIENMHFVEFGSAAIEIACPTSTCGTKRFVNNNIVNNIISSTRAMGISITTLGLRGTEEAPRLTDILFQDILISGNTITSIAQDLYIDPAVGGGKRNQLIGLTISNNSLYSSAEDSVDIITADVNSTYFGIPGQNQYSDDNLIQNVTISDNHIEAYKGFGIHISGANYGNSNNQMLDLTVSGNTITNCAYSAIQISASDRGGVERGTNNNLIRNVVIQDNTISQVWRGIWVSTSNSGPVGEAASQDNRVENVTINKNAITDFRDTGIMLSGGESNGSVVTLNTTNNVVISSNTLTQILEQKGIGLMITGGVDNGGQVNQNTISGLSIFGNLVNNAHIGLAIYGGAGSGAKGNQVLMTHLTGNDLKNNKVPQDISDDMRGAGGNDVLLPGTSESTLTPSASDIGRYRPRL